VAAYQKALYEWAFAEAQAVVDRIKRLLAETKRT